MLLEDLAEETSDSNRRAADRLEAEARALDKLRAETTAREEIQQQTLESARQATDYVISRMPQVEEVWRLALVVLRKSPTGEEVDRLLGSLMNVFDSGRRLVRSCRTLCEQGDQLGTVSECLDELAQAEARFDELVGKTKQALEDRSGEWQPADQAALAMGLQLAREGKTVTAAQARARFRQAAE